MSTEFSQMEPIGSPELGSCLGMKFSFFTEFVLFYSSASASTAGSSVMSFIEIRIFMSSPMDLVSLHVAQICRLPVLLMVRSKAGWF